MNRKILTYLTITLVCLAFTKASLADVDSYNESEITALLTSYEALGRFSGAIAIKKGDAIVYEHANGFANVVNKTKNGTDKIFAIGSLSKQFTASAILLLAQQGKLSLDDPIAKHLPYYQNEVGQKVTIYHLLTHTGGIPDPMDMGNGIDGTNDPVMKEKTLPVEKKHLIGTFKDLPNSFAPGSNYEYTNTGYILLADIIERASGKSYASFLKKKLFDPAGMTNTSADRPNNSSLLVESYSGVGSDNVHTTKLDNSWLVGAAGLYSTAGDLFKWVDAMNSGKILSDAKFDYLLANPVDLGVNSDFYGYGMEMKTAAQQKVYRHDGATVGTIADFIYFPEHNLTIIIYMNSVHNVNDIAYSIKMRKQITEQVSDIIFGHNESTALALNNMDNAALVHYVGHYSFDEQHQVEIISKNGGLVLKTLDDKAWSLYTLAQDTTLPSSLLTDKSTRLFKLLNTNKSDKLSELFDDKMASLPANVFEEFWQQLTTELGSLEANYSFAKSKNKDQVQQRLIFKNGIVDMGVFFNSEGKIEGIQNSDPIAKATNTHFSTALLPQKNDQLLVDGYVIKQDEDLFLKFTRNDKNQVVGFSYNQMGEHSAVKL
jgi:CubicO group peptidase (beta-lactamase class C family)